MKKLRKLLGGAAGGGFTLVELLIVISLLGAIAVIVIAAINPIELANRTRDTKFKSDSAQVVSAVDRYFASQVEFPWVTAGLASDNESSFGFVTAANEGVGICGADCSTDGVLISNNELKTEFRNRDFIDNAGQGKPEKEVYVGKESGTSESIYACFIPLSKSFRQAAIADANVFTVNSGDGSRSKTSTCDADSADWIANQCMVCVPE